MDTDVGGGQVETTPLASTHPPRRLSPLGSRVYVQRVRPEKTDSGLIFYPQTFAAGKSPRLKMNAQPDEWRAIVLAVGPDVPDLKPGDRCLVYNFGEDTGHAMGLFTGAPAGKDTFLVNYPDDFVCAVEDAPW